MSPRAIVILAVVSICTAGFLLGAVISAHVAQHLARSAARPQTHVIEQRDPRCDGPGRYQAMAEADRSGQGTGHACQ